MATSVNLLVLVKMEHLVMGGLDNVFAHQDGQAVCVRLPARQVLVGLPVIQLALVLVGVGSVAEALDFVPVQHLGPLVYVQLVTMVTSAAVHVTVSMGHVTKAQEVVSVNQGGREQNAAVLVLLVSMAVTVAASVPVSMEGVTLLLVHVFVILDTVVLTVMFHARAERMGLAA